MKSTKDLAGGWRQKAGNNSVSARFQQCAGFSMVEICIGLMLACSLAGIAVINLGSIMPGMHANKAMYEAVSQLRRGRQLAIAQRRNIQLSFVDDDQIEIARVEPAGENTVLSTVALGNKFEFRKFDSISTDTPDEFGSSSALDFGSATSFTFRPDGTLVDGTGNPANGTILIGLAEHPEVARAVTILGATGRVRCYRWTGEKWIQ
jgi:Tfp pilus assembly protein FimT